jgi:hypothetical protein
MRLALSRVGATVGLMLSVAAVTACSSSPQRVGAAPASGTIVLHASWADGYPTLGEMKQHAGVIVFGTVAAVAKQGLMDNQGNVTGSLLPTSVPFTDFSFVVASSIKGKPLTGTITIRQTGGPMANGQTAVVEDDPLLQVGDQDVLFLREYEPGHFVIMGGPAGRFPVTKGHIVSTMPGTSVRSDPPGELAQFVAAVHG